ncbi:hypothetical protein [Pseudomonas fluorescens]|uniref:hypothetical protein n=1 Tax=Pseudomonas fluorescens TaxID=294 RepID=UPI001654E8DD|nr:hypothetical protein [Pseudomonas fluorescens]MBC8786535.1 hypothetical protein [Pseudomonas fluorescens]
MKTAIAWIIHSILPAWIAKFLIEVPPMSDDTVVVDPVAAPAPVVAEAAPVAVVVAAPVVAAPAPAVPAVNTDTLKALLLTLGHDIEAEWEHLVALATKA